MRRTSWTGSIAAVCCGLALVACGGGAGGRSSATPSAGNEQVTIEVQGPQAPTDAKTKVTYDLYMKQAREFQQQHPNITLKPRYWKSQGRMFLSGHSSKATIGTQSSQAIGSPRG